MSITMKKRLPLKLVYVVLPMTSKNDCNRNQKHHRFIATQPKNKADALLKAYLTKRLNLAVNGNKSNLEYLGFEIQKESTWTYFEIKI